MGLFQHKKKWPANQRPIDESTDGVQEFFDEYFLELRNRGRLYYEEIVSEHAAQFKQDLTNTVARVDKELKDYLVQRLEDQFVSFSDQMKQAQTEAVASLNQSVDELKNQHQELKDSLQKSADYQASVLAKAFDDNTAQINALKEAEESAVTSLNSSVDALKEQHTNLLFTLEKNAKEQQAILTKAFEDNMAHIIEQYLLQTLGESYDLKAQLPAIIKQMEQNKQAMMDDITL